MDKKFRGYSTAAGCFLIMFFHLGAGSSIGVFLPHIANGIGSTVAVMSLIVSIATISAFLGSLILPKLIAKLGAKGVLFLGSIAALLHYVINSVSQSVALYYVSGVLGGVLLCLGTNAVCASIISSWFIEKRSAVIGIVFGGAAFGAATIQLISGQLIAAIGYRKTYLLLGIVVSAITVLTNLFLIRDPDKMGQKPLG